jgi:hypothetical protein
MSGRYILARMLQEVKHFAKGGSRMNTKFEQVIKRIRRDVKDVNEAFDEVRKSDLSEIEKQQAFGVLHRAEAISKGIIDESQYG